MANGGNHEEQMLGYFLDDFTCGICYELYNRETRNPKVLPCAHSICRSCLINCVKYNEDNKLDCADRSFCCPFCKRKTIISLDDVDELANNVEKMQLMEKVMALSSIIPKQELGKKATIRTCTGHGVHATHHCYTCDVFLCGKCIARCFAVGDHPQHWVTTIEEYLETDRHTGATYTSNEPLPLAEQRALMVPGAIVTRGRDWPRYWMDDGGPGGEGTVMAVLEHAGVVHVRWDKKPGRGTVGYRMEPGNYRLRLADTPCTHL